MPYGQMIMNTRKADIILALIVMMSAVITLAGQETDETPSFQVRRTEFKNIFNQLQPINIYGKVIDQDENPVAGAKIEIAWESVGDISGNPGPGQVFWATSDDSGLWEFLFEKPHSAFIADARKPGFDYVNTQDSDRDLVEHKTARNDPVIVRMHKKGETTFLIHHEGPRMIRVLSQNPQTISLGLLEKTTDMQNSESYKDVQIAVDFNRASSAWTITYSATNGADGVMVGTNRLYEAPQGGYENKVIQRGPVWPRYIYLRSRIPVIYTRIDLEYSIWKGSDTNQVLSISYNVWVNPYGSRNLEYESDLADYCQLCEHLEQTAKTALLQNKLPSKPDLPKLIKEAKEYAEKSK